MSTPQAGALLTAVGMWNSTALLRSVCQFLLKLHYTYHNSNNALLGISPKEMKTYVHRKPVYDVHSNFIIRPKARSNPNVLQGWVLNQQCYEYAPEEQMTERHNNLDESQKYQEKKKPVSKVKAGSSQDVPLCVWAVVSRRQSRPRQMQKKLHLPTNSLKVLIGGLYQEERYLSHVTDSSSWQGRHLITNICSFHPVTYPPPTWNQRYPLLLIYGWR